MQNITETVKHLLIINIIFFIASLSFGDLVYDLFALHYPSNSKFVIAPTSVILTLLVVHDCKTKSYRYI